MATKTNLISAINGFLTAVITQAKVRSASLETVNELYPISITETQTTTQVYTKDFTNAVYSLTLTKRGNEVNFQGRIANFGSSTLTFGAILMNITNSEFAPLTGKSFYLHGFDLASNQRCSFIVQNTTIKNVNVMPILTEFYINGTYITNP